MNTSALMNWFAGRKTRAGFGAEGTAPRGGEGITHPYRRRIEQSPSFSGDGGRRHYPPPSNSPAVFSCLLRTATRSGLSGGASRPVHSAGAEVTSSVIARHYGLPVEAIEGLRSSTDPGMRIGWYTLVRGWGDDMRPSRIAERVKADDIADFKLNGQMWRTRSTFAGFVAVCRAICGSVAEWFDGCVWARVAAFMVCLAGAFWGAILAAAAHGGYAPWQ